MSDLADRTVERAKRLAELFTRIGEVGKYNSLEIALAASILRLSIRRASPLLATGMDCFEEDQREQETVAIAEVERRMS